MKIMYICGMYVSSHGGAEISMYSLLKNLQNTFDWKILVITDKRYEKSKKFSEVPVRTISHKNREREINKLISEFKPDIILTQLMWSDIALKIANEHSIPSIMRVCKVPIKLNLAKGSIYAPTAIISISHYIQNYVLQHWDRKSTIINPFVETKEYLIKEDNFNPYKNKFIFMFNPLERKGGFIFKEIAKKLPHKKVGTVLGWSSLKDKQKSNHFSNKYIKRITESEGSKFNGSLPYYANFDDCTNVKVFPSEDNPKKLYKQIKVLLIPSQWDEAFGRVAIEAMTNGIPVIASNVAGLRDSVGKGGILVKKDDLKEWIIEILKFDDKKYYQKMSKKAKRWVKTNYSEQDILNKNANLIKKMVGPIFKKEKQEYQRLSNWYSNKKNKGNMGFTSREDFIKWYKSQPQKCAYCKSSLKEIRRFYNLTKKKNKRPTRGNSLEVDRVKDEKYSKNNCVLACYWCNNAKTDVFDKRDMKLIGKSIRKVILSYPKN